MNNEEGLQRRRRTKSKCTWNIKGAGQSHLKGTNAEEPAAPLSDFCTCHELPQVFATGRTPGRAGCVCRSGLTCWGWCMYTCLAAAGCTCCSLSGGLAGGAWLAAPNEIPQWRRRGRFGPGAYVNANAASGLLGYHSDMACQHYLLFQDAVQ